MKVKIESSEEFNLFAKDFYNTPGLYEGRDNVFILIAGAVAGISIQRIYMGGGRIEALNDSWRTDSWTRFRPCTKPITISN